MLFKSTLLLCFLCSSLASPVADADFHQNPGKGSKYLITLYVNFQPHPRPKPDPDSGDSYSQTGFNVSLESPSAANPLGNPTFPGWTTSGGTNWIGFLVSAFNSSLTLSYNFASGGATVDAALVIPFKPTVLSLVDQVAAFKASIAYKPKSTSWRTDNTLFAVWLGVNDIGNSNGNATDAPIWDKIISRYFSQVDILYQSGGRNFALLAVPPTQRSPMVLAESTEIHDHWGEVILAYNKKLNKAANVWAKKNRGSVVRIVDTQAAFNRVLDNPTAYGSNATGATCYSDDGTTCLWWNDYHPGIAIHKSVASTVAHTWGGLGGFF